MNKIKFGIAINALAAGANLAAFLFTYSFVNAIVAVGGFIFMVYFWRQKAKGDAR